MRSNLVVLCCALLLGACGGSDPQASFADEPALETDLAKLDAALACTPFAHPDKPPVLLVHGTFTAGFEQYDWTYLSLLDARGYDVCTVTYPDRGLGDMQVSAEYVVHALRRIHAESGRKVAMIGHSQGVAVPRWALKWWPSAREAVADFVMQAGPNHGTDRAALVGLLPALGLDALPLSLLPAVFYQLASGSQFIAATNAGDETPGEIDYTAIYTGFYDELVSPVETAMVDAGLGNPKVANILLQDVCPGRFVDHVTIGLTDRLSFELALDAIGQPGPANVERAGGAALCGLLPIVPEQIIASDVIQRLLSLLPKEAANGLPDPHLSAAEPELKPYAR